MAENKLSFDELSLKDEILRGIYSYGFENPSVIQHKSIPVIVSGKDIISQAQSGTGKTGAFSIGSLNNVDEDLKETQVIILSPTRELADQTNQTIKDLGKWPIRQKPVFRESSPIFWEWSPPFLGTLPVFRESSGKAQGKPRAKPGQISPPGQNPGQNQGKLQVEKHQGKLSLYFPTSVHTHYTTK